MQPSAYTPYLATERGTFVGDGAVNRAIPHRLGSACSISMVGKNPGDATRKICFNYSGVLWYILNQTPSHAENSATPTDANNFYVSGGANETNVVYHWVASI